ncbi:MAG: hypothetical protein J4G04_03300 [Nitrosopumilaceae archaeon]|nr:hypothetical protein [Nitrosopumilaceae archaeon]
MIALGVGMAAMAVLAAGMLLEYYAERDRIERVRDISDEVRAARLRESVSATHQHPGILLENRWGGDTQITGLIVICDGGAILSAPLNHSVPAGGSILISDMPDPGACT